MIRIISDENKDKETLLSWFARQTNTDKNFNSCYDNSCPLNQTLLSSLSNIQVQRCYDKEHTYESSLENYGYNDREDITKEKKDSLKSLVDLVLSYADIEIYCEENSFGKLDNNEKLSCKKWIIIKYKDKNNKDKNNIELIDRIVTYSSNGKLDKDFQTFYIDDTNKKICFWHPAKNANTNGDNLVDDKTSCDNISLPSQCTDTNKCYIKKF